MGTSHYYPLADIGFVYEKLDLGLVMCLLLPILYISQEVVTGCVTTAMLHVLYYFSLQSFKANQDVNDYFYGVPYFWFLLYLQAFSWIMQFIGHGVFEKRAPALLSNLFSALVAPDFVVIEILYMFGYNKKAIDEAQVEIDADISAYWNMGKKTKAE
eukprot:CAMPEP_0196995072 /NCGR_PEP_ID=MMETSP1380-20130617/1260_1 /TAXON_ID=5936 /ORGANISM="Euplotes crassus, Strain CT5" /LENGTH=156 /DNA_ID=CAMNT_0042410639 /DNA_START=102 /DNA_END=572 /DNA_ORIENTATION=-